MAQQIVLQRTSPKLSNQNSPSDTNHSHHNQRPPKPLVSPNNQQISIVPLQVVTSPVQASQDRVISERHNSGQSYKHVKDHEFFKEIRGSLMTVAILAAGSTYQAGLNPPGGFWKSDSNDSNKRNEGNGPMLFDSSSPTRYVDPFFYFNGMSFVFSLAIIIILTNKHFYGNVLTIRVLKVTMGLDLLSFMAAYAVGSCNSIELSIAIFVLAGGLFAYVVIITVVVGLYYSVPVLKKVATGARSGIHRVSSGFRAMSRNNHSSDDRSSARSPIYESEIKCMENNIC